MPFSVPLCSTVEETAQKVYQKVTKKVDKNLENDAENGSEPINNADSNSSSNNADGDNLDGQPGILNSVPLCSTVEETAKKVYEKVTKKADQKVDKNLENDAKNGSEPINNVDSSSNSNIYEDGQPEVLNSLPFCSTVEEAAKKLYHKVENVTKKAEQNVDKNLEIENENENDAKTEPEEINSNDSISKKDDDNLIEKPKKEKPFSIPLCSTIEENAKKVYQKVTKKVDKNLGNDEENGSELTNSSDSSGSSNFDIDNSYGQPGILESSTILTSQPVLNNSKDELKVLFGPVVGEV